MCSLLAADGPFANKGADALDELVPGMDEPEVDRLADMATALARRHGLVVMPALPAAAGRTPLVALRASDGPIEWFVDTAAAAGCRLLYVERRQHGGDQRPPIRALARRGRARTCELALAFSADGVLHRWTATAGWYERQRADLADTDGAAQRAPRAPGARPANVGKSWSLEEQHVLVEGFRKGATIDQLAAEFGRNAGGIRSRLQKLGLVDL